MKHNYIYGLDLSMHDTGVTVFDNDKPVFIGSIPTRDKDSHGVRLKQIYEYLSKLKDEYPPAVVCMERAFSRFNTSTAVIYRVHGVVNMLFSDYEQIYYPPKTIKEVILKGNATKEEVKNEILKLFPDIQFTNDDESDSFAICLTYLKKGGIL